MPTIWPILAVASSIALVLYAGKYEDRIYDKPGERLNRIKQDLVQVLKNQHNNKNVRDRLLSDIEVINALTESINDHRTLLNYLWIALTSRRRDQYTQLKFQQNLERLVNNDIFVKASKLETLV